LRSATVVFGWQVSAVGGANVQSRGVARCRPDLSISSLPPRQTAVVNYLSERASTCAASRGTGPRRRWRRRRLSVNPPRETKGPGGTIRERTPGPARSCRNRPARGVMHDSARRRRRVIVSEKCGTFAPRDISPPRPDRKGLLTARALN